LGRSVEDVRPEALPDLQHVDVVAGGRYLDAFTPQGIFKFGLPSSLPVDISHPPCQKIGAAAYAQGMDGVVLLSAVAPTQQELVIFTDSVSRLVRRGPRIA
jgi:hypothetical protein